LSRHPDRSNVESGVNMPACCIESTDLRRLYLSLCGFDFLLGCGSTFALSLQNSRVSGLELYRSAAN